MKISWVLRTFQSREEKVMVTLWKSLIQHHAEYCSQLWSPSKTGSIQSIELLQKNYFKQIHGLSSLSYWEMLKKLNIYSLERRRERYRIIYTWKILEKQVPNLDVTPIISRPSKRRGRSCCVPPVSNKAPEYIKTIREASLPVMGPRLFNAMPKHIRDLKINKCSLDSFKGHLDNFLALIPDEPLIPGLTKFRRVESNSVIDWVSSPYLRQQDTQRDAVLNDRSAVQAVTA